MSDNIVLLYYRQYVCRQTCRDLRPFRYTASQRNNNLKNRKSKNFKRGDLFTVVKHTESVTYVTTYTHGIQIVTTMFVYLLVCFCCLVLPGFYV